MRRRTLMQGGKDISSAMVTASTQTYSGSALTPTVHVILNGAIVDESGYDVAYSNNTNAGTATITVTGKGNYEGTATGSFTISPKALSITASNQTITYGNSISQSTSKVSTSGLVSGDTLTSIHLSQSTTSATTSGTITPSNAQTTKGISNYSVSYYSGTLVINKATGSVSFNTKTCSVGYDGGTTGTLYVRTTGSGWVKTSDKTVSGYNVYKSVSNYYVHSSYSVFKLTFVNSTGSAVSTTLKLGPATESTYDYSYIAAWNAADITSNTVPSTTLGKVTATSPEWTDVSVTIPTGTNTLQIVYRKDSSVANSPDCGYVAIPYDISFGTVSINKPVITGGGTVTWSSSNTSAVSVNSSTGLLTVNGAGTATITASMAASTNYTAASGTFTITVDSFIPIGSVVNFAYTGSVQSRALTSGSYKLQCWGAQGGSNATDSSYGITAKAGGKGGYAEGVLTIAAQTTLYAFVGGQGASSGNGGWNCGGGGIGSTTYTSGNITYLTKYACGGGATDFALVTSSMSYSSRRNNRSDASLLSRIIVAGGGSGGAMGCKRVTLSETLNWGFYTSGQPLSNMDSYSSSGGNMSWSSASSANLVSVVTYLDLSSYTFPVTVTFNVDSVGGTGIVRAAKAIDRTRWSNYQSELVNTGVKGSGTKTITLTDSTHPILFYYNNDNKPGISITGTERTATTDTHVSQIGYSGGGVNGDGKVTSKYDFRGRQDAAGAGGGSFGKGGNKAVSTSGYSSGCGGAGWYGGGSNNSSTSSSEVTQSGGGSGFVNIATNAQYRPSGYTGIELDSGTTTIGTSSFPSTSGGTETGHSGNGYAKITRLS